MRRIFTTLGVPPKVYQTVLTKEFGSEWITWLPETLQAEIERVWGVTPIPEVHNKLGALRVFLSTDLFYHDAAVFEHIVHAMNDALLDPDILELSSPSELQYALFVLGPFDTKKFEREIVSYLRVCCENAGLLVYPEPMKFAQPIYTNPVLAEAVAKIKPTLLSGSSDDIVVQQSIKLYQVIQQVVDKIAAFNIQMLEEAK